MTDKNDEAVSSSSTPSSAGNVDVFISHSSEDEGLARSLAREIERRGLQPWLDAWHLKPGQDWRDQIQRALDSSRSCVVLFSSSSSPSSPWISAELSAIARRAWEAASFSVIPLCIEEKVELPAFFHRWQSVQIGQDERSIKRAGDHIATVLRGPVPIVSPQSTEAQRKKALQRFAQLRDAIESAGRSKSSERIGSTVRPIIAEIAHQSSRLAESATDVSAMSEELATAAGKIATGMSDVFREAEHEVAGFVESRAAMKRLAAAARTNAAVAQQVSQLGGSIHGVAEQHAAVVGGAAASLGEIQALVVRTVDQIAELERLSAAIANSVDLIQRILSQRNLLALNAAIEAARAGAHGAGFAVVAEEVHKLAQSSAEGAEQIAEAVRRIREKTADITETIRRGDRGSQHIRDE